MLQCIFKMLRLLSSTWQLFAVVERVHDALSCRHYVLTVSDMQKPSSYWINNNTMLYHHIVQRAKHRDDSTKCKSQPWRQLTKLANYLRNRSFVKPLVYFWKNAERNKGCSSRLSRYEDGVCVWDTGCHLTMHWLLGISLMRARMVINRNAFWNKYRNLKNIILKC